MIAERIFSPRQYNLMQLLANFFFILTWFLANEGLLFWDDFSYLNLAHQINTGTFEITSNHFTSRIGLIFPTAWMIKSLGINEYTMVIYPLLCALGILNLTFTLGRIVNYWYGLMGAFLLICDYHMINFSIHLFPEMPLALCIFGFFCVYYLLLKNEIDYRFAGLLCALILLGALFIKTTVVLLLPLIGYLFLNDRIQKRNRGFWSIFIVLGIFFFALQGFWYLENKGSFFFRFQNIADNHVATAKTFFDKKNLLWKRLTYLPFLTFTKGGFFIPLILALPSIFSLKKKGFALKKPEQLWPLASLILILTYWFFSTTWRYYSPLPLETRHIMFLIPLLVMAAVTFWTDPKRLLLIKKRWLVYLTLGAFLFIPIYTIAKSGRRGFRKEEEVIHHFFVKNFEQQTIITDGLTSYGASFFYRMKKPEDRFIWLSDMQGYQPVSGDYLLINPAYFNAEYQDFEHYNKLKSEILDRGLELKLLTQEGEVLLYQIQ